MDPKICSILLVNYKTRQLTSICLNLIKQNIDLSRVDVWVVDNDSKDSSTAYLRTLSWIHFLERKVCKSETRNIAHAKALDLAMTNINTPYVLCLHTDTMIYDAFVLELLMNVLHSRNAVAVGPTDQQHRNACKRLWRLISRALSYYYRFIGNKLKLTDKLPHPYREKYLKSYCCLWNAKILKENGLLFCADDRNPGYSMQDKLEEAGFVLATVPTARIFKYLEHIQSGTMAETGQYRKNHRRSRAYRRFMEVHSLPGNQQS